MNLNFLRGCHYILSNEQFYSFHLHTVVLPSLSSHDPKFLLPLMPMALTYLWLSGSRHPFLIHIARSENLLYRINLAFMSGLIFVPLPTIYSLSCVGLMSGHLMIRRLSHEGSDLREEWRDLFGYNRKFIEE